jgi:hypothetical protein
MLGDLVAFLADIQAGPQIFASVTCALFLLVCLACSVCWKACDDGLKVLVSNVLN